jgi:hypothetical protein
MSVKRFPFPVGAGADEPAGAGPGALAGAGTGVCLLAGVLTCIRGLTGACGGGATLLGLGTWGGGTLVSFFGGALAGLTAATAAMAGRAMFLPSLGLGDGVTLGDVPLNPMLGNGATGLLV